MNRSILLVLCDVLVLCAMSLSTGGFSESGKISKPNSNRSIAEELTNAYLRVAAAARRAEEAERNAVAAKNEAEKAKEGERIARSEVEKAKAGEQHALEGKERSDAAAAAAARRAEEAERPVKEKAARIEQIKNSIAKVLVRYKNGKWHEWFTPIVNIGGSKHIVTLYNRADLKKIKSVKITIEGRSCFAKECISYKKDGEIYLFKFPDKCPGRALQFGSKVGEDDYDFWRCETAKGRVTRYKIAFGASEQMEQYRSLERGDVLILQEKASVISIAKEKFKLIKDGIAFDKEMTNDDFEVFEDCQLDQQ